jgi:hypothetical protein
MEELNMRYTKVLIPTALFVGAVAAGSACSASSEDGQTDKARTNLPKDPPGDNGTVKIQELGDNEEIPDNDPHVGCVFQIEFRGFDEGDLNARWTLSAQPPTGKETIVTKEVPIGGDPAGGANDVDAIVKVDIGDYDLSALTEHPQQGYHLKLEVHAEGSQGADTKFKVFWVRGCEKAPPPKDGGTPPPPPTDGGKTW